MGSVCSSRRATVAHHDASKPVNGIAEVTPPDQKPASNKENQEPVNKVEAKTEQTPKKVSIKKSEDDIQKTHEKKTSKESLGVRIDVQPALEDKVKDEDAKSTDTFTTESDKSLVRIFSKDKTRQDKLTIVHFNDVYNIEPREKEPVGGAARFVSKVKSFAGEPMILFSGDCLNPSLMSSVTKGKQMLPVLNGLPVTAAVYGNHDFDFGVDHLVNFRNQTDFPWLMSNVKDKLTKTFLADGVEKIVAEWHGHKIGIIGLVEEEWLVTLSTIDAEDVEYTDFIECARSLAKTLRKDEGCEFVIALTHMRVPNDLKLLESDAEVDLILGGHDHHYETKESNGKVFVKSGTDFRELSEITIDFSNGNTIKTKRHEITSEEDEDETVKKECNRFMTVLGENMEKELGRIHTDLDGRFSTVRTKESNLGNLICDIMRTATQADIALLNSGSLRSDTIHPAGPFTMKDLVSILPMVESLVVLKITGEKLLEVLENSVSQYPKYEGRFLQVSGISFVFDGEKEAGERVCRDTVKVHGDLPLDIKEVYTVATKYYVAKGKDGYGMLADCPLIIDEENGPVLTTIIENHFESVQVLKGRRISRTGHRQSLVVKHEENQSFMEEQRSRLNPKVEGRIRLVGEPEKLSPTFVRKQSKLVLQPSPEVPTIPEDNAENPPKQTADEQESGNKLVVVEKPGRDDSDLEEVMQSDQTREDIEDSVRMDLWEAVGIDDLDKVKSMVGDKVLDFRFWTMEKTLLHHAAQHNSTKCLQYLIDNSNLTVHVRDQILKNTALFYAAENGCKEASMILLDSGSKINARNTLWETPLHAACEAGHGEVIILLLARGADRSLKNKEGATPKI